MLYVVLWAVALVVSIAALQLWRRQRRSATGHDPGLPAPAVVAAAVWSLFLPALVFALG